MPLPSRIKDKIKSTKPAPKEPLWKGPESNDHNGGVTFSLLTRWLSCRERARIALIEGLRPNDQFNKSISYGNMWHVCEEALAGRSASQMPTWEGALKVYQSCLMKRYPLSQEQIIHWANVCRTQFPLYVNYWSRQPDVLDRTPLLQEAIFDVLYTLPSGRVVRLRGKWDSVDLIGKGKSAGVFLQENKTKGDIDEIQLKRQLSFDLQTMMYLVALECTWKGNCPMEALGSRIKGVRYNVVRRPLSGGKGSIVRHKPTKSNPQGESAEGFYGRLKGIIEAEPQTYFMRWRSEVTPDDVKRFRRECLDPILEQLCEWYQWVKHFTIDPFRPGTPEGIKDGVVHDRYGIHWRHPFGSTNWLDEGGSSDLDEYLATGSEVGLTRVDRLFTELEG